MSAPARAPHFRPDEILLLPVTEADLPEIVREPLTDHKTAARVSNTITFTDARLVRMLWPLYP